MASAFQKKFVREKSSSLISEGGLKTCRKVKVFCDGVQQMVLRKAEVSYYTYRNKSGCYYWVCFSPLSNAIFTASAACMPSGMKKSSSTISHQKWKNITPQLGV